MHLENRESNSLDLGAEQLVAEAAGQNQLLVDVLDTISDRVFLKDAQGLVTYVNQAFLRTYGLSSKDVLGKRHEDFLPPEMISPCLAADKSVLQRGESICLETHWVDHETGVHHWSETHKSPLRDQQGEITGIVGVSRDITARRTAEEELKRQKALLELIIETVPDQIFVKDLQSNILLTNHVFYEHHHLKPEQVIGQNPTENFPKILKEFSEQSDAVVLKEGRPVYRELAFLDHDGREVHYEIRKMPLLEENQITGIVALCRDLTEQRQAEQQSKRNETLLLHASRLSSIGELVAGIAHEVNQPLYSILNYAKAVENSLQDDRTLEVAAIRKWVQQIHKEAARGGKITQRLKSFVKRTDSQQEPTNLNQVVAESLEFVAIEARDAGLAIEVKLAENLPSTIVDRIQIQQVLVNLLKNAIEALTEHATTDPRIVISTRRVSGGVEVSVADGGPGISTQDNFNILEPFQTTKHDGLGLGLAISNSILEAHQGQLTYQPNDWGGVTFSFTLLESS